MRRIAPSRKNRGAHRTTRCLSPAWVVSFPPEFTRPPKIITPAGRAGCGMFVADHSEAMHTPRPQPWAVILAGGEGARLRPLTRRIAGDERPKQFCALIEGETLLDRTRRRV